MQSYDVAIVGAGPGSLKAAEFLAQNGKSVVVLERGKIIGKKVCAGGITLKNFKFGISKSIMEKEFKKVVIHTPKQTVEIKSEEPLLYTTSRVTLGQYLAKEAKKKGAEIRTESCVAKIEENNVKNTLSLHNLKDNAQEKIAYKYLIGGDGSASIVRTYLGIRNTGYHMAYQYIVPNSSHTFKDLELFLDTKIFGAGYGWIFPYTTTTSIGAGADLNPKMQNHYPVPKMRNNFNEWFEENFNKRYNFAAKEFQAFTVTYGYHGHEFGNKFLIGDAAGFSSSLTAEGIYQAMLSGIEVAKKIVDPGYNYPELQRLIAIKKKEDRYYHAFHKIPFLTNLLFECSALLLRNKRFAAKTMRKINTY